MNDQALLTITEVPCSADQTLAAASRAPTPPPDSTIAARRLIWVMAIACGLSVANLYYNQPLLADMARGFHVTVKAVGFIPTMTQMGYAIGLLLLVPLGDILQRRRLVVSLLIVVTLSLVAAAAARNLVWLAAASLAIGIFTVVPQVLISLHRAAHAARAARPGGGHRHVRAAHREGPRKILTVAAVLMLASFAIFWAFGSTLAGLAAGVILLDLAMQSAQVANQTRIYSLPAEVHSRVNTAYMGTYFIGGAGGSLAGSWGWALARWPGVCAVGLTFAAVALAIHLASKVRVSTGSAS